MGWNAQGVLNGMSSLGSSLVKAASAAAFRSLIDVYSTAESRSLGQVGEMGYAENTGAWTTTNTAYGSTAAASLVTGCSITVVGEGRPVDIVFTTSAKHTVASVRLNTYLLINGAADHLDTVQAATVSGNAVTVYLMCRKVLTFGVSYTFQVGMYASSAGTITATGSSGIPMQFMVTRR